jgi:hypothetical protein
VGGTKEVRPKLKNKDLKKGAPQSHHVKKEMASTNERTEEKYVNAQGGEKKMRIARKNQQRMKESRDV